MASPTQTHEESEWERDAIAKYGHLLVRSDAGYCTECFLTASGDHDPTCTREWPTRFATDINGG